MTINLHKTCLSGKASVVLPGSNLKPVSASQPTTAVSTVQSSDVCIQLQLIATLPLLPGVDDDLCFRVLSTAA